ncbi:MAG: copper chaperone PCu(A)C [Gammaproteobacteria bacterium]|jgi:copper(I)-binding protein|nr:MAG: copper chaperone PCu(A)C [Gammaproteobacteria bacterium]
MNARIFTTSVLAIFLLLCQFQASAAAETVMISNLRVKEAPPAATATAGYFSLHNHGSAEIELTSVTSTSFGGIELHRTVIKDGVASMQRQDSIKVPAGGGVEFKPGDLHLMLFSPAREFRTGDTIEFVFHFADGMEVTAPAKVEAIGDQPASDPHHTHH